MNKAIMIGRITKTPELQSTGSGKTVVNFTIASRRSSNREKTDFFDCVAWGGLAELVSKHVKKGDLLSVAGELQSRHWEDGNGNKRKSIELSVGEVEFLQKKENNSGYFPDEPAPEFISDEVEGDLPF